MHALEWDGQTHGLLVTADETSPSLSVQGSLQALASHVSLALESAALTDEVLVRTSEARLSSLVQHASDLITVIDADARVLYQSPSIERVLGYTADEVLGRRFDELLAPGEETRLLHLLADEHRLRAAARARPSSARCATATAAPRQFEILRSNLLHDENVGGIVLNGRDVSERKAFEEQLAHQAFHDPVTNLANRALFVERVRHAIARTRRDDEGLAVIFLDLDDFKTINDSLGHAAGDQVLVDVAKRLDACIRGSDTAARFGGDEFAVLLEDVESLQEASDAAERILEAFTEPLRAGPEGAGGAREPRHRRGRQRRRRRGRRADPQRRRRDVHRQARRQGRLPDVRARDARGRAGPARAARRPAARDREQRVRAALPAGGAPGRRRGLRARGAAALAAPGARPDAAGQLHPVRRGDRPDRADRPLGAARGLPQGEARAGQLPGRAAADDEHQPVA